MMILVGGGSGFVGRHLINGLRTTGHKVMVISRSAGPDRVTWDDISRSGLPKGVKAVVNLSGRNVLETNAWLCATGQYSSYKKEVLDSRIGTTQLLVRAIQASSEPPSVLVNASAIAFYNPNATDVQDEDSPGGTHDEYLDSLISKWEGAAREVTKSDSTRLVIARIGIVMGHDGGLIQRSYWPFFFGLGGRMGSGTQWHPWIHVDDMAGILQMAVLNPEVKGVLNGVAPHCPTNAEFTTAFGRALGRPTVFPVPEFALRLAFGERSNLILQTAPIAPRRVLEYGYEFKFPDLEGALKDLVK